MDKKELLNRYGKEHPKRYLWHCTRLDYVETILQEGIIAKNPEHREYKLKGVYLSEYRFNWMWNTTREGRVKGATLKIDVSGLKLIDDYHLDDRDTCNNSKTIGKDFIFLGDIEPERIKEVWIETEPQSFQRLNFPLNVKHTGGDVFMKLCKCGKKPYVYFQKTLKDKEIPECIDCYHKRIKEENSKNVT